MMMSLKKEMVALAQQQNNYVYIVRCRDQTLYTGWTNQLEKRIEAHNAGKGAKYTKARRPVELVYFETFEHKSEALKREYQIKQLKRSEKEKLILSKKKIYTDLLLFIYCKNDLSKSCKSMLIFIFTFYNKM